MNETTTRAMNRRPGVLVLVSSLRFGGAEKHAVALVNELDRSRFRVHLAYIKPDAHLAAEVGGPDAASSLEVRRKFEWRGVRRLARLFREQQIDIAVCTNGYPLWYALAAKILSRRPVRLVEVLHTTIVQTFKSRMIMAFNQLLFRWSQLLVYVSHRQREFWRARGMRAERDVVIQNGVDAAYFSDVYSASEKAAVRARFGFGADDYVIGLCAALRPEKAHGDLLEALARLRGRGVQTRALLIGDGRERARIEQRIQDLQLNGAALITGYQKDVRPYIAACDVMVLTSHAIETFSIAALESMALGKPLVLTRIGGADEQVVDGDNGRLYAPGDIDALATHLLELADPQRRARMGARALELVRSRFTRALMISAFEREFMALLDPSAGASAPDEPGATSNVRSVS